jgi:hypothetical protein
MPNLSDYTFVTRWTIPATVDCVWPELMTPERWPEWWRGVERVVLLRPGGSDQVGAVREYTWRSRLPYRLTFVLETTRIEPQRLIEGRASGELEGIGRWQLTAAGTSTQVRYDWQVRATKRWMQLLAPLARPLFAWNHDVVMEWGRQGLVERVRGCT